MIGMNGCSRLSAAFSFMVGLLVAGGLFAQSGVAYREVAIGSQTWMSTNLDVDRFRNGDPIPEARTYEEWERAAENREPAWCHLDNDPANGARYGRLYNWYAVSDPRGLTPEGWRVPIDADWRVLTEHLGGREVAGGRMKSSQFWNGDDDTDRKSLFASPPGGMRGMNGFFLRNIIAGFWSTTEKDPDNAGSCMLHRDEGYVDIDRSEKGIGYSVRCIRGDATTAVQVTPPVKKTSSVVEVRIGSQTWMARNLDVDRFRNGDPIPEARTAEDWKRAEEGRQPAWCHYEGDMEKGRVYGKLYNWYAVSDPRGLAPEGWHVPADEEWARLTNQLGGDVSSSVKLKSAGGWNAGGNGTNSSGFSLLPGGYRSPDCTFMQLGFDAWLWSASGEGEMAWFRSVSYRNVVVRFLTRKGGGLSVRCVKD